ncbi:MAG: EscU/YscU/HrcU family type III secretion system export apparatus switch protein [Thermoanaerobaculia bacterium]
MAQSSQQKTEKPTPRRLREARKKGQVAFSRDASGALGFAIAAVAIFMLVPQAADAFGELYMRATKLAAMPTIDSSVLAAMGLIAVRRVPSVLSPLLIALFIVGLAFGFAQTRFLFSAYPLKPELKKLSPMKRLKEWFSVGGLVEFTKTLFKLLLALAVAYLVIRGSLHTVMRLGFVDADDLARFLAGLLTQFLVIICILFIAVGGLDFLFQRWKFMRDQRMTKEEVRRDYKEMEGDPLIRSERRKVHRQIGSQDLSRAVTESKVVLIDAAGHAVAVAYDRETMPAPKVVAKGQGRFARRIIDLAAKGGVAVVEDAAATRALYRVAPDSYVPRDMFETMAEILTRIEREQKAQRDPFAA